MALAGGDFEQLFDCYVCCKPQPAIAELEEASGHLRSLREEPVAAYGPVGIVVPDGIEQKMSVPGATLSELAVHHPDIILALHTCSDYGQAPATCKHCNQPERIQEFPRRRAEVTTDC
jgi:hypothetical protein